MIKIKKYNDLTNIEIYKILQARNEVFVVEQNCVYQDIDNKDLSAYHCFINDENSNIVAYIRILEKGVTYKDSPSIGRVLVTLPNRRKGYASLIMNFGIEYIFNHFPEKNIVISAQKYLVSFYSSLGFNQVGDPYLEDDIPHVKMILTKTT